MADRAELADDLALIESMMRKGRRAAALDGRHLIVWGALLSTLLLVQYVAEVGDWAPSAVLWLWQPLIAVGFLLSLVIGRRAAGRRLGNAVSRTYMAAFAGAGITIILFLLAGGVQGRPDPLASIAVLSGALATACCVMAVATSLRWMGGVALGWWLVLVWFAGKGPLVPTDFLVLSGAAFLLLLVPGVVLVNARGREASA